MFDNLKTKLGYIQPDIASDDPQTDVASQGWSTILNSQPVQQALDFGGNLDRYGGIVKGAIAGDPDAQLQLAHRSLGTAMAGIGTINDARLTPNGDIRKLAQDYMNVNDLKDVIAPYAQVNPETGAALAKAYQEMSHTPNDAATQQAYQSLINETLVQYQKLKELGLNIEKIKPGMENPYPQGSKQLFEDINNNKHLWYYPTENGFGTENTINDHPLLTKTNETINGESLPANDIFRIVHDVFGHAKEGLPFGPRGEENAWREHSLMYSPEALKALTSETRGQNSWVNFGPHGEANRTNPGSTTYADQKAGILPDWAMNVSPSTFQLLKQKLLSGE